MHSSTHKPLCIVSIPSPKSFKKIYRCWIVWGQNIYVVIIPSLMALAYFGTSIYLHFHISKLNFYFFFRLLATYLAADGANIYVNNQLDLTPWGQAVTTTSFVLSMAVSTLVTGLIVFKILKVFLEVKAASNSVNRTTSLGSSSSCSTAGGNKLQHVVFVIIESGMALFIIQLIRVVFVSLEAPSNVFNILIAINNMFNVSSTSSSYKICFIFLVLFFTNKHLPG